MTTPTADDVMTAIDEAAAHLPHLQISITTRPMARAWRIDPDRAEIYISGHLTNNDAGQALLQALDELSRYHELPAASPRRPLQLVPALPIQRQTTGTRTGTAD